jgi:hypothetical protein
MRMREIYLVFAMLASAGCQSFSPEEISDRGVYSRQGDHFSFTGKTLIAEFDDPGPSKVASVTPLVHDGDLYLNILSISGAGPSRFEIDVSSLGLGQNWSNRVYIFSTQGKKIDRWKVEVVPLKEK